MASITYTVLTRQEIPVFVGEKPTNLFLPQEKTCLSFRKRPLLSFSSLARKQEVEDLVNFEVLDEKGAHTLPLGAETGTILHEIFEKIFKRGLFLLEHKEEREL